MEQRGARNATLALCGLLGFSDLVNAGDLTTTGSFSVESIVSDNIQQASDDEAESDIGLIVSPAVRLESVAGRLNWALDLGATAQVFARTHSATRIDPELTGTFEAEILPDNLFLEGLVNLRQSFTDTQARGGDGRGEALTDDNQTNVFSLALGPLWRSELGSYAQILGSYRYEYVQAGEVLDATQNHLAELEVTSGRYFDQIDWRMSYLGQWSDEGNPQQGNDNLETGQSGGNPARQEFRAEVDYELSDDWVLSAVAGYDDGTGTNAEGDETQGGAYWSLGGTWNPSRIFSSTLLLGPDNREFQLTFSPTRRTDFQVSVVDRKVGRDAGLTWSGQLNHRTRYSTWILVYEESSTSQAESEVNDVIGDPAFEEVDDLLNPQASLGLTNASFFRRRLQASADYNRGRSQIGLRGAFERREFSGGDDNVEQTVEAGITWRWLVGRRTSTVVDLLWEDTELLDGRNEVFISLGIGLAYLFSEDLQGLIGFTHLNRDNADDVDDSRENRLGLLLRMEF